jgi:hypothetical protein
MSRDHNHKISNYHRAFASEYSFRNHRLSIPHFSALFPLTYKIPLSYIPTVEKENLIN